jgi:two-component system sensor histidine kinase/response regulator
VAVKDEGRGISESDLTKLFTFQIRSKAGTNNENGSGIGLQLTYDFIKLNGGRIEVQSAIGKGATFLLYLKNQQG